MCGRPLRDSLICSDVVDVRRFRTEDGMDADSHEKVLAGESCLSVARKFRLAASSVIK